MHLNLILEDAWALMLNFKMLMAFFHKNDGFGRLVHYQTL